MNDTFTPRLIDPENRQPEGADDIPKPAFVMPTARILEPLVVRDLIRQRQKMGIDLYDEVWEGVYVVPPLANNPHQTLVNDLAWVLTTVFKEKGGGVVHPGANVSDRRKGWKKNFRCPDVVVVLEGGKAVDCDTHWMGGPDFLIEVKTPGDDTEEKIPFYASLGVRELLVVQRDTRELTLYRLQGTDLVRVGQAGPKNRAALGSDVVPLKFSWKSSRQGPQIVVQRTGRKKARWTV